MTDTSSELMQDEGGTTPRHDEVFGDLAEMEAVVGRIRGYGARLQAAVSVWQRDDPVVRQLLEEKTPPSPGDLDDLRFQMSKLDEGLTEIIDHLRAQLERFRNAREELSEATVGLTAGEIESLTILAKERSRARGELRSRQSAPTSRGE